MESFGPALYRQERVGRNGKSFTILKLRSMTVDAEKDGVAKWAAANDSRVTRVGKFIRKTRIDELPQLFNVLRGEMSFVGPRPERPSFVSELKQSIPYYDLRHSVKPGLTGWAQVRFSYGASLEDATKKLHYDLYYVKNHSLMLDMLILFETVRVILRQEGSRYACHSGKRFALFIRFVVRTPVVDSGRLGKHCFAKLVEVAGQA
jgi:lipopolysaccharide/colanic/teichoic acid biosynthesis glycosyltransferase